MVLRLMGVLVLVWLVMKWCGFVLWDVKCFEIVIGCCVLVFGLIC